MEQTVKKAKSFKQCDEMEAVMVKALDDDIMDEDDHYKWIGLIDHQRVVIETKKSCAKMNANPNTPTVTHDKHGRKIKAEKL